MSRLRSEHLGADHAVEGFVSGKAALDDWLRRSARHAEAANTGRTFVWVEPGSTNVVAYFTLAAHLVRREAVPRSIGHGSPSAIPAILLARLALDRSLQGQGLGGQLLLDALQRAGEASSRAAARLVVVDAIDGSAAEFYLRFGFRPCPAPHRLVRKTSEIIAALRHEDWNLQPPPT
ncbi:MAG TPA: GNAT family N-acetyltransferase [Nocardioidaceae bacterium]|nr:GNAT family N-acetyltransferase [Nocardioidaceae bacterium]